MSVYNTLQTAVSGMAAQANKLGTIGDNIANSSTTGYKDADTQFETVLGNSAASFYASGGVQTHVRYGITQQGEITGTASVTDLAIKGEGFFVVRTTGESTALTRAGSFVPDAKGNLVNTAGFTLMGYNLTDGSFDQTTGIGTLKPVNVSTQSLSATASTAGTLTVNLPSAAVAVAGGSQPSTAYGSSSAQYTQKTSLIAYDNLGAAVNLDIYMTKTGSNQWEVSVFNQANASSGVGFPYSSGPLATQTLTFDGTTGKLDSSSASSVAVPVPNGKTVAIDMSQTSQLASNYQLLAGTVNGNSPSKVSRIDISTDGTVSTVYDSGTTSQNYRIPLASVESPNNMTVLTGNIYQPNIDSGPMNVGAAKTGKFGEIDSSSLESSTVDLATQLTQMITTQRNYEANSKVLTTGSEMLSTIIQAIRS